MTTKAAFISRHQPTEDQIKMAAEAGYDLTPVGDRDAFKIDPLEFSEYKAVVVVHPAAALRMISTHTVLVFENVNRAPVGEKPQFKPANLHVFNKYN